MQCSDAFIDLRLLWWRSSAASLFSVIVFLISFSDVRITDHLFDFLLHRF